MRPAPPRPHDGRFGVRSLYQSPGTARVRKRNKAARDRGEETGPVDCAPYTAHVRQLHAWHMTDCMIAAAAGCSNSTIGDIREAVYPEIRRLTAASVLQVGPHPHPRQKLCLAVGAQRRLRGMQALGWRLEDIAAELSLTRRDISQLLNPARKTMTYTRWVAIAHFYERHSMTPGPSDDARRRAKAAGYVPPLAWEGLDIDHPAAQPDWAAAGIKLTERPVCPRGHAYTAANTKRTADGRRSCRTCRRTNDANAKRNAAQRAAAQAS